MTPALTRTTSAEVVALAPATTALMAQPNATPTAPHASTRVGTTAIAPPPSIVQLTVAFLAATTVVAPHPAPV